MSCFQISLEQCAVISALTYSGKVDFQDLSNYRRFENFESFIDTTTFLYNANVNCINHLYSHLPEMKRETLAISEVKELLTEAFFESLVKKLDEIDYYQKIFYLDYYEYQTCDLPDYSISHAKKHIDFIISHLKEKSGLFEGKKFHIPEFTAN